MAILRGDAAAIHVGYPLSHVNAFQRVANRMRSIIMSRAVGGACTGLIEESYASKGFHIKAKSCNWGPMAGFVMEDPNLSKRGPNDVGNQTGDLLSGFNHGATSVPLYISNTRKRWLQQNGYFTVINNANPNRPIVRANQRATATGPAIRTYEFKLKRCSLGDLPPGGKGLMWAVLYHNSDILHLDGSVDDDDNHARAMVDPLGEGVKTLGYRAAMTGDYDLFALWAHKDHYSPDKRIGGGSDKRMTSHRRLERDISHGRVPREDPHLGNMTGRLRMLRDELNREIKREGYAGGNMVHHSDEAGRPFVRDVDLPVIVWVPGKDQCYALQELGDLRQFIRTIVEPAGFAPTFNPGWMKDLALGGGAISANALQQRKQAMGL